MKRDMELVRKILLSLESSEHGFSHQNPSIDGYSTEQIGYHAYLMSEAGLVQGIDTTSTSSKSPSALAVALRWSGHEFLEASRKPEIWSQAKEVISRAGGASFEIWKAVLTDLVKSNLSI